ncbi:MAG: M23 family metallopeptidase [Alphaproteobacteria bacterium]|nr:M23 family metallopeptidase [Alphaproteobacteria bacterium]
MGYLKKTLLAVSISCIFFVSGCSSVIINGGTYRSPTYYSNSKTKKKQYFQKSNQSIIIQKGDTVYSLSRKYNVSNRDIIIENNLTPPFILKEGMCLRIPAKSLAVHIVKRGDTIYSISRVYSVDMSTLIKVNDIKEPYILSINSKLKIPAAIVEQKTIKTNKEKRVKIVSKQKIMKSRVTIAQLKNPPKRGGKNFDWPVNGEILTKFGPAGSGLHNDGINIKVKEGTSVKVAENGIIAYAGNELKGFGNLILVKHSDGWMTAYAHVQTFLAKRGDIVQKGQIIAKAGKTGNAKEAQLHFEIRKGIKAVNPLNYLASR